MTNLHIPTNIFVILYLTFVILLYFMKSNDLDILLSIRKILPTPQGYVITKKENDIQTGRQEMS